MLSVLEVISWLGLSIADWATIATASFTATAAGAAWRTVVLDQRRQVLATRPNLTASLHVIGGATPHQKLELTSAGPGIAVGSLYFGVEGATKFGGFFGKPTLLPHERTWVMLPNDFIEGPGANFIWSCRDATSSRLYLWSHHGGHVVTTPATDSWPSAEDVFRQMYPEVEVPDGDTLGYPTE